MKIATFIFLVFFTKLNSQPIVLDSSFDGDGKKIFDEGKVIAANLRPDGNILFGTVGDFYNNGHLAHKVTCIDPQGNLVDTFGENGNLITPTEDIYISNGKIEFAPDGSILFFGKVWNGVDDTLFCLLTRYLSTGEPDDAFANSGRRILAPDELTILGTEFNITCFTIQEDDKIVLAGDNAINEDCSPCQFIIRLNEDGSIDESFSEDGISLYDAGFEASIDCIDVVCMSTGDIVATGLFQYPLFGIFFPYLNIFSSSGEFIGQGGLGGYCPYSIPYQLKAAPDGYLLGISGCETEHVINYFDLDFTTENMFGENGVVPFNPVTSTELCHDLTMQHDGKILAAGRIDWPDSSFILTRYLPNGALDLDFANNGYLNVIFEGKHVRGVNILVQGDSIFYLIGTADEYPYQKNPIIAKLINSSLMKTINPVNTQETIVIFPQPINEDAFLEFEIQKEETLRVLLEASNGEYITTLMSDKQYQIGSHTLSLAIPSVIPTGIYIITLKTIDNKRISRQVFIR